ncbi:HET-domain-containing protein, partial [Polyplosphaeria fusca]
PFNYPPLPSSGYIRLLHLDPHSDRPSELRGSLRIHKLDAQCQYEAISYAWGDYPEFNKGLILDGQALKITGNLYAALMAYRYPNRTRVLWADAVCINQTDTAEKTQQIAIMADIYNKARTVQVWLAPASQ